MFLNWNKSNVIFTYYLLVFHTKIQECNVVKTRRGKNNNKNAKKNNQFIIFWLFAIIFYFIIHFFQYDGKNFPLTEHTHTYLQGHISVWYTRIYCRHDSIAWPVVITNVNEFRFSSDWGSVCTELCVKLCALCPQGAIRTVHLVCR